MKNVTEDEWPTIGVRNLSKSVEYYRAKFGFELIEDKINLDECTEVRLKLFDFYLILVKNGIGPIYKEGQRLVRPKKYDVKLPAVLYIPVPDSKKFYNSIKDKGGRIVTKNKFWGPDFEGVYVFDNDGNRILFFRDHHGPYEAKFWHWVWEREPISKMFE
jgi:catechol 2,3-dioxygenase-like lactoylglutathione lyase family enzyme